MGDATVGLLALLSLPVAFALLILGLRLHHRRSASRASHTELVHNRRSHAERQREMLTRAQHQGRGHGGGGVV